jgi:hypothetical protein
MPSWSLLTAAVRESSGRVGELVLEATGPPEEDRWGVFHVGFACRVHDEGGLVEQLREWLPELRRIHRMWKAERSS